MCKLLVVLGTKKPAETRKFMSAILGPMSKGNSDGIGYTAVRSNGNIFTERWLNNNEGLQGDPRETKEAKIKEKFGKLIDVKEVEKDTYKCQGDINWGDVTSVIMHTRYATCARGFENVHPFVDNENVTSIAHNGVINNHKDFKKLNSTCDSEVILTEYNKRGIGADHKKSLDFISSLSGYWATAITTLDGKGKRIIDLFTSNKTTLNTGSLMLAYIKELDGYVFCSQSSMIKDALKSLSWNESVTFYSVNPHVFTRFDAVTGDKVASIDYSKNMVTFQVKKGNYNQSKTHCTHKKNENDRRLLSPNSTSSKGGGTGTHTNYNPNANGHSGTKGSTGVGTNVYGIVGRVASFYAELGDATVSKQTSNTSSTTKGLSNKEIEALEYYEDKYGPRKTDIEMAGQKLLEQQNAMDQHPDNYSSGSQSTAMKATQSEIENDLANWLDAFDAASDSKYPVEITATELSDKELDELDEFEAQLNEMDKEILGGLPTDMRYKFLHDLKKDA